VAAGAWLQARAASIVPVRLLRAIFVLVLGYVTYEMAARALGAA
jgi:uncharacterized membrane protein YfcA